jgi:hypothetical protein
MTDGNPSTRLRIFSSTISAYPRCTQRGIVDENKYETWTGLEFVIWNFEFVSDFGFRISVILNFAL